MFTGIIKRLCRFLRFAVLSASPVFALRGFSGFAGFIALRFYRFGGLA
jgi:hypothetical protein